MNVRRFLVAGGCALAASLVQAAPARAQFQTSAQGGIGTQPTFTQPTFGQQPFPVQPVRRERTQLELGVLYGTSVAYGVGMGVWVSTEIGFDDPALFLIPPALLGVAAPVGVYLSPRVP